MRSCTLRIKEISTIFLLTSLFEFFSKFFCVEIVESSGLKGISRGSYSGPAVLV